MDGFDEWLDQEIARAEMLIDKICPNAAPDSQPDPDIKAPRQTSAWGPVYVLCGPLQPGQWPGGGNPTKPPA